MTGEIEIELLDKARLLVADSVSGDLVLHFTTVAGDEHYFGVTLEGAISLVARWGVDVRQIMQALDEGSPIAGETESPKRVVN